MPWHVQFKARFHSVLHKWFLDVLWFCKQHLIFFFLLFSLSYVIFSVRPCEILAFHESKKLKKHHPQTWRFNRCLCIFDGSYACTDGWASRNHGSSFRFGGGDKGTPLTQCLFKFHHINQENNLLIWNMAILNTWSIKITARRPQFYPPTPPPNTVALHYSAKQWFCWLFLKFSLCSLAFGKMSNNKQQYLNICKLRRLYTFRPLFLFLPKGFKVGWFRSVWYLWFLPFPNIQPL